MRESTIMNKQMPFGIFLTGGRRLLVPVLLAAVYVILPINRSDAAVVCSRRDQFTGGTTRRRRCEAEQNANCRRRHGCVWPDGARF